MLIVFDFDLRQKFPRVRPQPSLAVADQLRSGKGSAYDGGESRLKGTGRLCGACEMRFGNTFFAIVSHDAAKLIIVVMKKNSLGCAIGRCEGDLMHEAPGNDFGRVYRKRVVILERPPTSVFLFASPPLFFDASPQYDCSNPCTCDALRRGSLYRER